MSGCKKPGGYAPCRRRHYLYARLWQNARRLWRVRLRFDDKSFDLCVDFTGALTATSDVPLWWQYAGNCGQDTSKTPAAAAKLRALTDAIAKEPDAAVRKQQVSDITSELIKLNYFYNLVDMTAFQAYNKNLELPRISNSWIDWSNAYWTS